MTCVAKRQDAVTVGGWLGDGCCCKWNAQWQHLAAAPLRLKPEPPADLLQRKVNNTLKGGHLQMRERPIEPPVFDALMQSGIEVGYARIDRLKLLLRSTSEECASAVLLHCIARANRDEGAMLTEVCAVLSARNDIDVFSTLSRSFLSSSDEIRTALLLTFADDRVASLLKLEEFARDVELSDHEARVLAGVVKYKSSTNT